MGYTDNLLAGSFTERARMIKGLLDLMQAERLKEQGEHTETKAALDNARRQLAELRAVGARGATGAEVAV